MLSKLVTYAKYGNLFCGVEHTTIDGKEQINGLVLKKKKGELILEKSFEVTNALALKENLNTKQHFFLIINNNQILSKMLEGVYDTQKAIATAFQNLNSEDFYYEVYTSSEKTFVSICRQEYVDTLLQEYKTNELNVIGFSLGSLTSVQLISFVKETSLKTSNSSISFHDQELIDITPKNETDSTSYNINGLEIKNDTMLPLAGIISYYTNQKKSATNFEDTSNNLIDNFKQQRVFDVGLKVGLGTVFISLLVSFLFFSNYNSKINEITAELELNKTYKNSLLKLSDEVNKKERLVTDFSLTSSKASWYLDQIGSSIPTSILLTEIQLQPLTKSIKKEQEILINEHEIIIKGKSNNSNDFSSWTRNLERQNWIEKVTIQDYGIGKKVTTEFELLLELKK